MPAQPLTGAGFFGKLPVTGDFVSRGIGAELRRRLDRWISLEIVPLARAGGLPGDGLRFLWPDAGLVALMVESRDSAGREYPLVLLAPATGAVQQAAEAWANRVCDLATAAARGGHSAETLQAALAQTGGPEPGAQKPGPAIYWLHGGMAHPAPGEALAG